MAVNEKRDRDVFDSIFRRLLIRLAQGRTLGSFVLSLLFSCSFLLLLLRIPYLNFIAKLDIVVTLDNEAHDTQYSTAHIPDLKLGVRSLHATDTFQGVWNHCLVKIGSREHAKAQLFIDRLSG